MAASAVSEVVALIGGREPDARRLAFPLELVIRKSTGPVLPAAKASHGTARRRSSR